MSLACVLSLAIFWVGLQSWELCLVLGIEFVPRQEEGSTGKYQHEVEGVPEGATRGNSRDRMLVFPCTPQLKSRYRHYPICKSDEAVAIAITIAIAIASA